MARPTYEFRSVSKENYDRWKQEHPGTEITFGVWENVIRMWNSTFMQKLLEEGKQMTLPHGLGKLQVVKYKPATKRINKEGKEVIKRPINWKLTKEAGRYVYHMNYHTDGYKYFIQWKWQDAKRGLASSFLWKFEACRVHSRKLAEMLLVEGNEYKSLYRETSNR